MFPMRSFTELGYLFGVNYQQINLFLHISGIKFNGVLA
jgi:hypothetical protein